jgi:cysteine desulfurase family protein (TIGR01976 family)
MSSAQVEAPAALDISWVRSQFPSLAQTVNGHPAVFFDGPGGTQVPQRVIDAISHYLRHDNANAGGAYATSQRTQTIIDESRLAMGDFLNCSADEIVIGQNMTSLTYMMSRSIGRELSKGDEILLTQLDHDANISPWRALEELGVVIRMVDISEADCTLDLEDLRRKLSDRTKLVAVGLASNAVGTINPVAEIVRMAHEFGALVYADAVHYAPHGLIDVKKLNCDFLVCSTYKFFGPHMGVLYGKREHLENLHPYKVRALSDKVPVRWEWGTLNHECMAGITAGVDYFADLGRRANPTVKNRREAIRATFETVQSYERSLMEKLMLGLHEIPGAKVYGITDPARFDQRCPTIAVRIAGHPPLELATKLGERGFFTWDGNYYAINLSERLDVEKDGGFLRIGLVHYNTMEEVERLIGALKEIAR